VITIDTREENHLKHSIELQPLIESRGVKTKVDKLKFGDYCWEGNGPHGMVLIGVERKRIRDLLSCIRTGHLHGLQTAGMHDTYDECYLLVEGIVRSNPDDGLLEEGTRNGWRQVMLGHQAFMWEWMDHFLITTELQTRFRVWRTGTQEESATQLASLFRYWQKEWGDHKSARVFYRRPDPVVANGPLPFRRRAAKELTSIGYEKSIHIANHFRTARDMALAGESEWMKIPGIGETLAKSIVNEWNEDK
jgi:ERCC4-type nuclease